MVINILIGILFIVVFYSVIKRSFLFPGAGIDNFMTKESTGSIKGFAIIMIAFSHICQDEPEIHQILLGGGKTYRLLFSWGAVGVSVFFLLSGYGCFLSINRAQNEIKWLCKHTFKLLCHFAVAYAMVIASCSLVLGVRLTPKEIITSFFLLKMPGTTTWYLKIQLLFYVFLMIAIKISKKYSKILVTIFVFCYAFVVCFNMGLPDYWWKTSMCFAAGCCMAYCKDFIYMVSSRILARVVISLCGVLSYLAIILDGRDGHFVFGVQLFSYVCLSFFIIIVWDWICNYNKILYRVGVYSLDCYLIHVGVVDSIYLLRMNADFKTLLFMFMVFAGTVICYKISEKCYGKIYRLVIGA